MFCLARKLRIEYPGAGYHLINGRGAREKVQLAYQAHCSAHDFVGVSFLFGRSKNWRSLTPYVLTRHIKYRGPKDVNGQKRIVDSPMDQIKREVALRWPNGPDLVKMEINGPRNRIPPMQEGRSSGFRPFDFFRYRKSGSTGGGAFNFEIEFEEPVRSHPIALGYACHYGLGLFVPALD